MVFSWLTKSVIYWLQKVAQQKIELDNQLKPIHLGWR